MPAIVWLPGVREVPADCDARTAKCGAEVAGLAMLGWAMAGAMPRVMLRPCASVIVGRIAREVAKITKRCMLSTWVPGQPGLSCLYIHKDALSMAGVSSNSGRP